MGSIDQKVTFLTWLTEYVAITHSDTAYLLNRWLEQPHLLEDVHLIEQAQGTNRGLTIDLNPAIGAPPLQLSLNGHVFTDFETIYYELHFYPAKPLYLEIIFDERWQTTEYLAVLEDNPQQTWNTQVSSQLVNQVESYLDQFEQHLAKEQLKKRIDQALEQADETLFYRLTHLLKNYS